MKVSNTGEKYIHQRKTGEYRVRIYGVDYAKRKSLDEAIKIRDMWLEKLNPKKI